MICRVTVKTKDYRESGRPAGPPGPPEVITGVLMTNRRVNYQILYLCIGRITRLLRWRLIYSGFFVMMKREKYG